MKSRIFHAFVTVSVMIFNLVARGQTIAANTPVPKPVEDVYFGTKIIDPYRYIENMEDEKVKKWFQDESKYTISILNKIPGRKMLIDKMREFDKRKAAQVSQVTITDNDRYFYLKGTPSDEIKKLFYRDGFSGKEILLYDPQTFNKDTAKKYVISAFSPRYDGKKIAFEVAPNGSESSVLLIMDVDTKKLYQEKISRCWFASPSWLPDGMSFLYNRLQSADVHDPNREKDSKTYMHMVGTDPEMDKEIFSREKYPEMGIRPEDFPIVEYNRFNKYLFGYTLTVDSRLKVFYAPGSELMQDKINWKPLFKTEDEVYWFTATDKDIFIYTPKNAPNFKLLKTSLQHPDLTTAQVIVPERAEKKLEDFSVTKEGLYYTLSHNGVEKELYRIANGKTEAEQIPLPFKAGSVYLETKNFTYPDLWIYASGWTRDQIRYRYLPASNTFQEEHLSSQAKYPEFDDLVIEELMISSHDGVKVPLSLIYKKGIKRDGNNPVLFSGYGAYGVSINPFFSPNYLLFTQIGGIWAVAHVRGGGELGDQWYKAGYKTTKQNTWKDLISCSEYLIQEKYTSPKKIAINSASAGGILVGRAMTERPDLFAAAIPEVGLLNPLRAENSPNGPVNAPEFGTIKDSVEFHALLEMDAYLHVKDGESYPATLITAGMNDPRVIAWQPAKFAARLRSANKSGKPILFFPDFEAGHGIGNTKTKQFESRANVMTFALWQAGHPEFQPKEL